ncbi:MAG: dephospho-CoA kinase [Lautropia sp.]
MNDHGFKVGLTGGIGSGKSTVADGFAALGVPVVDTDAIAHRLTAPGGDAIDAIRAEFGAAMIAADGRLDRAAMRAAVFADAGARRRLEAILHPLIRGQAERETAAAFAQGAEYLILAIPLLVESGNWHDRVDRVLVVDCPVELQIERVIRRSGLTREAVLAIIAAQATREARLAAADDVIDNSGTAVALTPRVAELHRHYRGLARRTTAS